MVNLSRRKLASSAELVIGLCARSWCAAPLDPYVREQVHLQRRHHWRSERRGPEKKAYGVISSLREEHVALSVHDRATEIGVEGSA